MIQRIQDTFVCAEYLASVIPHAVEESPLLIGLSGCLGTGKTTFVRALLRSLGYEKPVRSPTYTLLEAYCLPLTPPVSVYHTDLYRLSTPESWFDLGLEESLSKYTVCLIEWPEKAGNCLPDLDLCISFQIVSQSHRINLVATSSKGERLILHA